MLSASWKLATVTEGGNVPGLCFVSPEDRLSFRSEEFATIRIPLNLPKSEETRKEIIWTFHWLISKSTPQWFLGLHHPIIFPAYICQQKEMSEILIHWVQGFREKNVYSNINHHIPNIRGLHRGGFENFFKWNCTILLVKIFLKTILRKKKKDKGSPMICKRSSLKVYQFDRGNHHSPGMIQPTSQKHFVLQEGNASHPCMWSQVRLLALQWILWEIEDNQFGQH